MTTSKAAGNVAKLRDVFNVKDPAFGAIGNGVTDDTSAINACVTAASAGSVILFPPGTYKVSALTHPSTKALHYRGEGGVSGPPAEGTVLTFSGATGWSFPLGVSGSVFSSISCMELQSTTTGQIGLQIANHGVSLYDVRVSGFLVCIDAPDCVDATWRNIQAFASETEANSIALRASPAGTQAFNANTIINLIMDANGTSGTCLALANGGSGVFNNVFIAPVASNAQVAYSLTGPWSSPGNNTFINPWSEGISGTHISDPDTAYSIWIGRTNLGTGTVTIGAASTEIPPQPIAYFPAIAFGGSSTGITYGTQYGRYMKSGNRVFIDIRLTLTSKGVQTGTATITLPIAVRSGVFAPPAFAIYATALDASVTTQLTALGASGSANINLYRFAAGASTVLADTNFANNSDIIISGSYEF